MGILFVNPSRRGKKRLRVSGRAKVKANRSRKRRMPKGLAAYWAKKRRGKKSKSRRSPAKKRRGGTHKKRKIVAMAKKRRRARRGSKRRVKRRSHRRSRKRTKRRAKRRHAPKRRRRTKRARRAKRRTKRRARRRTKRRSKRRARRRTKTVRRRRRRRTGLTTVRMSRLPHMSRARTLKMNPRRRRRKSSRRRKSTRRRSRRVHRRYGRRHYRKNPGGMLIDLAKRAAPVLLGLYGARLLVSKLGPRIPGVSRLGALQSPLLAVGAVLAINFVTKKVGRLAKYRSELLLGTGLNMVDTLIRAFAPDSVKAAIGVGDGLGDYMYAPGMGAYAEDPSRAMGDYVQMGEYVAIGDVEEELGTVDEELGAVEEELGDQGSWGEGVSQSAMLKPVPRAAYLEPVPTRSYLMPVPPATQAYDNPAGLYQGIFSGGAAGATWNPGS